MANMEARMVGGNGGCDFVVEDHQNNRKVERIRVVWSYGCIKAIQVWLTGKDPVMYGEYNKEAFSEFSIGPGEVITCMDFYANNKGDRLGWIYIRTNKNRVFDVGAQKGGGKVNFDYAMESGIWIGLKGRSGADIDCLAPIFLYRSSSSTLINNMFIENFDSASIKPVRCFSLVNTMADDLCVRIRDSNTYSSTSKFSIESSGGLLDYSNIKPDTLPGKVYIPFLTSNSEGEIVWESDLFSLIGTDRTFANVNSTNTTSTTPPLDHKEYVKPGNEMHSNFYTGTVSGTRFSANLLVKPDGWPWYDLESYIIPIEGKYTGVSFI